MILKPQSILSCLTGILFICIYSCKQPDESTNSDSTTGDSISVTNSNLQLKGQNFMVPSPVQIASILKDKGALYNKSLLNPAASSSRYSEDLKRALNLGVYGADLGYTTMYENTGDALEYYKVVLNLGDQLRITGSFGKDLLERFGKNVGNKDSAMKLVGETYRKSDEFLKDDQRGHIAILVLTGGWVESMHFALNVYEQKQSQDIAIRIGEQKNTCNGILRLLEKEGKAEFQPLIGLFNDLNAIYRQIEIKYAFVDPVTDNDKKITTINGKTEVKITAEQLAALRAKTDALRNYMIN